MQFRGFAGYPVCNLQLRSVVRRHDEILAASIREVVIFHSNQEELRPHVKGLPFAVVADPEKKLYVRFGVESGVRSLLDPRLGFQSFVASSAASAKCFWAITVALP